MELTPLDTELLRLHQTLSELINAGLVEAFFFTNEKDEPTRYRVTDEARAIVEDYAGAEVRA